MLSSCLLHGGGGDYSAGGSGCGCSSSAGGFYGNVYHCTDDGHWKEIPKLSLLLSNSVPMFSKIKRGLSFHLYYNNKHLHELPTGFSIGTVKALVLCLSD